MRSKQHFNTSTVVSREFPVVGILGILTMCRISWACRKRPALEDHPIRILVNMTMCKHDSTKIGDAQLLPGVFEKLACLRSRRV